MESARVRDVLRPKAGWAAGGLHWGSCSWLRQTSMARVPGAATPPRSRQLPLQAGDALKERGHCPLGVPDSL